MNADKLIQLANFQTTEEIFNCTNESILINKIIRNNKSFVQKLFDDVLKTLSSSKAKSDITLSASSLLLFNASYFTNDTVDEKWLEKMMEPYIYVGILLVGVKSLDIKLCRSLSNVIGSKLVALVLHDCSEFTWNREIKTLFSQSKQVMHFDFKNVQSIEDSVMEQLSIRYQKSMKKLNLEGLKNVTNNSLFQIGRRCKELRDLKLICCPKISDNGLLELTRSIKIQNLDISHNFLISDNSILALLSSANKLETVVLNNCPKLTDEAVSALYESFKSWGKSRNTESQSIQMITLSANFNFTQYMMTWLSTAAPSMKSLDLTDCPNIDLNIGLQQIKGLRYLTELRIGPCKTPISCSPTSSHFMNSLLPLMRNIKVFHLSGINGLVEEQLAVLIENCLQLEDLSLEDIDFGSLTIESVCSNLPNISKISLIGSQSLEDIDLRCLATICLHIKCLTIHHCNRLTENGFVRCVNLRYLEHLDLSYCTTHLCIDSKTSGVGSVIKYFPTAPLQSLKLDGLLVCSTLNRIEPSNRKGKSNSPSKAAAAVQSQLFIRPSKYLSILHPSTRTKLKRISLRDCSVLDSNGCLDPKELRYILENFAGCIELDLTGCGGGETKSNDKHFIDHANPFLVYTAQSSSSSMIVPHEKAKKSDMIVGTADGLPTFCGYRLDHPGNIRYEIFYNKIRIYREHYGARLLQRLRHRYKARCKEIIEQQRMVWNIIKIQELVKIQSWIRMHLTRKSFLLKLFKGRQLVHFIRNFFVYRNYIKLKNARTIRKKYLLKSSLHALKGLTNQSLEENKSRTDHIMQSSNYYVQRKFWKKLKVLIPVFVEMNVGDRMHKYWEKKFCQKIMRHWKTLLKDPLTYHKRRLVVIFLQIVDLDKHNSSRQMNAIALAKHYNAIHLMRPCYLALATEVIEKRRLNQYLIPLATSHFQSTFFQRVVKQCLVIGFKKHRENRQYKRVALSQGQAHHLRITQLRAMVGYSRRFQQIKKEKAQLQAIIDGNYHNKFVMSIALTRRLPLFTSITKYYKLQAKRGDASHNRHVMIKGMGFYKLGIVRMKILKRMTTKAIMKHHGTLRKKIWMAWTEYQKYRADLGDLYMKRYVMKLGKKCLKEMLNFAKKQKMEAKKFESELQNRLQREEEVARVMSSLRFFQAKCRGILIFNKFQTIKTIKLSAIMTIQNVLRMRQAKEKARSHRRKRDLNEAIQEEHELDLMRDAEAETKYYDYHWNAALTIQRTFRGWQGRDIAALRAIELYRIKTKAFYDQNYKIRINHENFKRAMIAKENQRNKCASQIQKLVRGRIARKEFKLLLHRALMNRHAVYVQRDYRRRLARLKLDALRRDRILNIRHHEARKQRGFLLRLFGLRSRKLQRYAIAFLDSLGIDPITFKYSLKELVDETVADFHNLVEVVTRERLIFQQSGLDSLQSTTLKRSILVSDGWRLNLKDAVRIIEPGHKYFGYTGVISRIDEGLQGAPLYEIRLDKLPRLTYTRMTTDPLLVYLRPQPLSKIEKRPNLQLLANISDPLLSQKPLFGLNNEDPFYAKKNVSAAWRIQCSYRCYRARRMVARKRYEVWTKSVAMQWSMINHLTETNSFTFQGYLLTKLLRVRPKFPIFFNEIRHPLIPGRVHQTVQRPDELLEIRKEYEARQRDRIKFLQKSALTKGKEFFAIGFQRITLRKKWDYLLKLARYGFSLEKGERLNDALGTRGVRYLSGAKKSKSKRSMKISGMDKYAFEQFKGSPHVRYYKSSLYQGEWAGIPLFSRIKPHGEGLITFLDGWSFSKEFKVLYLTIVRCRYLNVVDLTSSDPFCEIICNGSSRQTSVKWDNLDPEYHESFEIDVTNPSATLNIVVKDKSFLTSDTFMGQISLKLADFSDGLEHTRLLPLRGEDLNAENDDVDRGEIEIILRWADRIFADDQVQIAMKLSMAIRLQGWTRKILAINMAQRLRVERANLMKMVRLKAVKITNTCRIRLARKEVRKRTRFIRAAIRIQKRIRIFIARRVVRRRRNHHYAAIRIETRVRVVLAKKFIKRLKAKIQSDLDGTAAIIQKNIRRALARMLVKRMRKEVVKYYRQLNKVKADAMGLGVDEYLKLPVVMKTIQEEKDNHLMIGRWIGWYGVDPEYGLKRNRRITERLFKNILKTKHVRLLTHRFGVVYVDSYPPRVMGGIEGPNPPANELQQTEAGSPSALAQLTERNDFVAAYLPSFKPEFYHRSDAIQLNEKAHYIIVLHIETSLRMRATVDYAITTIQCMLRQRSAMKKYRQMLRVHAAISNFQKIFRRRYEKLHRGSCTITALFRMIASRKRTNYLKKERRAAIVIQCTYRWFVAMSKAFDLRSVAKLAVLKSSPDHVTNHGPEKALEHRMETFWMVNSNTRCDIRVELGTIENIKEIWIMTSTFITSPQFVSIEAVVDKKSRAYEELIDRHSLPLLKGNRWHRFDLPMTQSKYFKLIFFENYGDENHIAVRQIRFIRAKEKSVTIVKEPLHYVLVNGPSVGENAGNLVLSVEAEGWPTPTYQWYFGSKPLPGETSPDLKLNLVFPAVGQRTYRCIRCKMISNKVPINAYHVRCGNCSTIFIYKEIEPYDKAIRAVKEEEEIINREIKNLKTSRSQILSFQNADKYQSMLADLNKRVTECENTIQILREKRIEIKKRTEVVNAFKDEGIYTCYVQNIRGGSVKIIKKSIRSVVVVEHSKPYVVEVYPQYRPRLQFTRKNWNIYASLSGTFTKGKLEGLVSIRYTDGAFYEGPYIDESGIDSKTGLVHPSMKVSNHYGIYTLSDGRKYEGVNVDNHFDPNNLQTNYRLTLPNKEVYEGMFCDEKFHGIGLYRYADGSIYEGQWFRGTRFGHGHFRGNSPFIITMHDKDDPGGEVVVDKGPGWCYEGFFDTNRRHRKGVITWNDGSCYMGDWYYDDITGKGVYITSLRDVYRGELLKGIFHGCGELIYSDGSRYVGHFKRGMRWGKGVFTSREGEEYYGHFEKDRMHGEHVVKLLIAIEEKDQDNYEIRVGEYSHGKFVKWKTKFSNPIVTKQFIRLFQENRDMFDSVYSMILAKSLPNIPEGIDANNRQVKNILFKVRFEAMMLVGQQALNQAQAKIESLYHPIREKKVEVNNLRKLIEDMSVTLINEEKESAYLDRKYIENISQYEKDTLKIEQYWHDDRAGVRQLFLNACKNLDEVTNEEYFAFRNHRVVPIFVKKIFDAISYLLNLPTDWSSQQFLIADSIANTRNGDEEAARFNYVCKLSHLMKEDRYKVYDYCHIKEKNELLRILSDSRFRRDSYYIESTGPPGPYLLDWIRTNYNYCQSALKLYGILVGAEQRKIEASRYKAMYTKKKEGIDELVAKLKVTKQNLKLCESEYEDLEHALLKAKDLLEFVVGRYQMGNESSTDDYYKLLEQKLEANRDRFMIEVAVQGLVDQVIHNIEKEKRRKIRDAKVFANLMKLVTDRDGAAEVTNNTTTIDKGEQKETDIEYGNGGIIIGQPAPLIKDWIIEEVKQQQSLILQNNRSLGYGLEPEENAVSVSYTSQIVSLIVELVSGKLNDSYNEAAAVKEWLSLRGRRFNMRFLYILSWHYWEQEAIALRNAAAIDTWNAIFGGGYESESEQGNELCARMAIEAGVSTRMSKVAREQAKIWAASHKMDFLITEGKLSDEFEAMYPENTANIALQIMDDDSDSSSPTLKAQSLSWTRLHPNETSNARTEKYWQLASEFKNAFPELTAEVCFRILNGWGTQEEMMWVEYAEYWKSFNMEEFTAASDAVLKRMADEFSQAYPLQTNVEAAKKIFYSNLINHITEEAVKATYEEQVQYYDVLNAHAWGVLNQGLLRKGTESLDSENRALISKQWAEMTSQTQNFTKGSCMLINNEQQGNEVVDRFVGFRNRLSLKYSWVHAYYKLKYSDLMNELENHKINDPINKIVHNVRPSRRNDAIQDNESKYLDRLNKIIDDINNAIDKITQWNTYFGYPNDLKHIE